MLRRPLIWILLPGLVGLASLSQARPEEAAGTRLTLKKIFAGPSFTSSLPRWSWRPGHAELVRLDRRRSPKPARGQRAARVLRGRDPESGVERDVLDLSALEALVPGKGRAIRGIGRRGAPAYQFSKDGNGVVANVKGDLVWVDLVQGTKRRLTKTSEPLTDIRISPDGRFVSFSRAFDLWAVGVEDGEPRRLTSGGSETLRNGALDWVYPEELGFGTAAWWAPDGSHVAWLQLDERAVPQHRLPKLLGLRGEGRVMRYPRAGDANPIARIGVVGSEGGETAWLALGDYEYVARVAWTPDASRVLVVTLDRPQQTLRLLSCDPLDGSAVPLFEETDAAWVDVPPAPRFVDGDHFLWRTHRDGSTRYERVELDEKRTKVVRREPITPAGYDASGILHLDNEARRVTFEGRKHGSSSSSVYVGSGDKPPKPARFVSEPGFSTSAALDESGAFAVVSYSDAVTPTRREIWRTTGELLKRLGDARTDRFDALALAEPEEISLPVEGGLLRMRLWKPADLKARLEQTPTLKLPVIVQVYAGPGSLTVRNRFGRGPLLASLLTQRGYLVLQIDGRGTGGQGARFKRLIYRKLGVLEIEDQARGVRHVAKRGYVDGDRVGIWGWSFGGTMACNAVTMQPDVFKVAVAVAPVTDWRLYDTIYTERYMDTPKANPGGYRASSATAQVKAFRGHLLLMHGMGDDNVHVQNTYRLVEALIKAHKSGFDIMTYPRRAHGLGGATLDVYTRLVAYFDRHL